MKKKFVRVTTVAVLATGLAVSLAACGGGAGGDSGASAAKRALESGSSEGWCGDSGTGNHAYSGVEVTEGDAEGSFEWSSSDGYRGTAYVNLDEGCVTSASVSTG